MTEVAGQPGNKKPLKTLQNTNKTADWAQSYFRDARRFEISRFEIRVYPRESAEEKFLPLR